MRELLKLDVAARKFSKLLKKGQKAADIIKIIGYAWTVFNIIAVIWSLIPKTDSINEVDGDELIEAVNDSLKEQPAAE